MAYFLVIPISFRILIYFTIQGGATPFVVIKDFYNWIYTIFVLCGLFYTIPVFVVMLVQVGVLPMKYLRGRNKFFAYLAMLLIFWVFGPDPTPLTGLIIMAPFIVVFEIATFIGGRIEKTLKRKKEAETMPYVTSKPSRSGFFPFSRTTCKFCNSPIATGTMFCTECHRATK